MLPCVQYIKGYNYTLYTYFQPGYMCLGFAPVVDGPGGFIPDLPTTLRENLGADSVPLMSGICRDDGAAFTVVCKSVCHISGRRSTS